MSPPREIPKDTLNRVIELIVNYENHNEEALLSEFHTILKEYQYGNILKISNRETPYTLIADYSRYALLELLLQYNTFQTNRSSIDTPNSRGLTPFNLAVHWDDLDCVELLLNGGIDISKESKETISSAFLVSIAQQNYDCLKLLLFYHTSLNLLSPDALTYALNALDTEDAIDGNGPIHKVVLQSYQDKLSDEELEELHKKGLEDDGRHDYEILHLLLSTGMINLNQLNSNNESALALALHDPIRVRILLDNGADVNVKQGYDITPLILASRDETVSIETMRLLLERGANVTDIDEDGETALFQTYDIAKIDLLLQNGAVINHRNIEEKTAYQLVYELKEQLKNEGNNYRDEDAVLAHLILRGSLTSGGKKAKKKTRKRKAHKKRRKTKGKR